MEKAWTVQDTIVVVPCFNEARRLPIGEFESFLTRPGPVKLMMVDDGSTDGTFRLLNRLQCRYPRRCSVVTLPRNRGKAFAVHHGLHCALKTSKHAAWIGYWDADLSTPLCTIEDFRCFLIKNPQTFMVFGARVQLLSRDIVRLAWRHYLGRFFATMCSMVLGLPIYDTQCGAKLFRRGAEIEAIVKPPFFSRWAFDVEIVARWIALQKRNDQLIPAAKAICEYPLHRWHHVAGSKISILDGPEMLIDLWRIHRFLNR